MLNISSDVSFVEMKQITHGNSTSLRLYIGTADLNALTLAYMGIF